jgi:hypothetical protein
MQLLCWGERCGRRPGSTLRGRKVAAKYRSRSGQPDVDHRAKYEVRFQSSQCHRGVLVSRSQYRLGGEAHLLTIRRPSGGDEKCSIRLSNQTELRTQMSSRKIATAQHCRRGQASVYPATRDGWPAGARKQSGRAGRWRVSPSGRRGSHPGGSVASRTAPTESVGCGPLSPRTREELPRFSCANPDGARLG